MTNEEIKFLDELMDRYGFTDKKTIGDSIFYKTPTKDIITLSSKETLFDAIDRLIDLFKGEAYKQGIDLIRYQIRHSLNL